MTLGERAALRRTVDQVQAMSPENREELFTNLQKSMNSQIEF